MREKKDSGYEWIGEIPISWKIIKGKYLFCQRNQRGNTIELQLLSPTQKFGVIPQSLYEELTGMNAVKLNEKTDLSLLKTIHKGDYCISLRSFQGGFEYSQYEGVVSPAYQVFYPIVEIADGYYKYLFKDSGFIEKMNSYTMTLRDGKNIAFVDFGNTYIPYPTVDAQRAIATFLDIKCAEIDALIADIQAQIDTLEQYKCSVITEAVTRGLNPNVKMQESGHAWVGKIPVTWKMKKGKYLFAQKSMRGNSIELQLLSPTQKFGVIPQSLYEELTGMSAVKLNERADLALLKTIHKGDFCISLRSFQGGFEYSEYEGVVSPAYQVFSSIAEIKNGYYKYLFKECGFIEKMNSYTMTLRDGKNIVFDDFGNTYIPYPPIEEQAAIAAYLDDRCAQIDGIIADKKIQLKTLDDYKKSLIFEYVTGKKEAPAIASPVVITAIDPHVLLAGITINGLGTRQLGKIQLEKALYLFDYYLGLELNTQYRRYPHGPYDLDLDSYLSALQSRGWFKKISSYPEKYAAGENYCDFCEEKEINSVLLNAKDGIEKVLAFIKTMKKTSQVERVATLFAAWNDFLLDGITPSDDQIIQEVMNNWTENKGNTQYLTWKNSLGKLKRSGIIPKGIGLHTLPMMQKGEKSDA